MTLLRATTLLGLCACVAFLLTGCYSVEQSMVERGYRWIRRGKIDTALTTFDATIKKYPRSLLGHLGRADALFEARKDREAASAYSQAIALLDKSVPASVTSAPGDKEIVGHRPLSYQNQGFAFPFGLEAYLYLRRAGAFHGLAFSGPTFDRDGFQQALADYDHALRLAPAYPAAREGRDRLLAEAEKLNQVPGSR